MSPKIPLFKPPELVAISLFCQGEYPEMGERSRFIRVDLIGRRGVRVRRPGTTEANWERGPEAQECRRPLEAGKDKD